MKCKGNKKRLSFENNLKGNREISNEIKEIDRNANIKGLLFLFYFFSFLFFLRVQLKTYLCTKDIANLKEK